jgi:hypothetical protein
MGNRSSSSGMRSDTVILEDGPGGAGGGGGDNGRADDEAFATSLRTNMQRLILYAKSSDPSLQRDVAERIANEAVVSSRRALIIQLGGLDLLIPLAQSKDTDIQRLAAHAMANLSVEVSRSVRRWDGVISLKELTRQRGETGRTAQPLLDTPRLRSLYLTPFRLSPLSPSL